MPNTYRAVLFDLDGTLLDNDMDVFLPRYFKLLTARVSHLVPPDRFVKYLLQATDVMVANDGRATNEEVFAEAFYPLIGRSREEIEPVLLDFYTNDFGQLRQYTRCRPEARIVVQAAFDAGCEVVISTNPLFPATAILQRIEWAGVADFPYRLVTTYENSRACKPNLLYYNNILETIGQPAAASLVVGDDAADMVAARLGCTTFYVCPEKPLAPGVPEPEYKGALEGVVDLLRASEETLRRL
jgi:FMN phosphatase YigB (HAD superfamily)